MQTKHGYGRSPSHSRNHVTRSPTACRFNGPKPAAKSSFNVGEEGKFIVLGPKGKTIRALQEETGARLELDGTMLHMSGASNEVCASRECPLSLPSLSPLPPSPPLYCIMVCLLCAQTAPQTTSDPRSRLAF